MSYTMLSLHLWYTWRVFAATWVRLSFTTEYYCYRWVSWEKKAILIMIISKAIANKTQTCNFQLCYYFVIQYKICVFISFSTFTSLLWITWRLSLSFIRSIKILKIIKFEAENDTHASLGVVSNFPTFLLNKTKILCFTMYFVFELKLIVLNWIIG